MATVKQKKAAKILNDYFKEYSGRYLYLLRCNKYYKIGISSSLEQRIDYLQIGNPYEIDLLMAVKIGNSLESEKLLHERFSHRRVRGEWFELDTKELEEVKDLMCRVI